MVYYGLAFGDHLMCVDAATSITSGPPWNGHTYADLTQSVSTPFIVHQDPSHSTESAIFLRCSKLSCGLEFEVNGVWYLWDPSSSDTRGGAGAMILSRDGHRSGAPTPTPVGGRRLQATSSGGWGTGGVQGNANGDDDYDGTEDVVTVSVFSHQVREWRTRVGWGNCSSCF